MLVARCKYETGCTEPKIIQFLVGRKDEIMRKNLKEARQKAGMTQKQVKRL